MTGGEHPEAIDSTEVKRLVPLRVSGRSVHQTCRHSGFSELYLTTADAKSASTTVGFNCLHQTEDRCDERICDWKTTRDTSLRYRHDLSRAVRRDRGSCRRRRGDLLEQRRRVGDHHRYNPTAPESGDRHRCRLHASRSTMRDRVDRRSIYAVCTKVGTRGWRRKTRLPLRRREISFSSCSDLPTIASAVSAACNTTLNAIPNGQAKRMASTSGMRLAQTPGETPERRLPCNVAHVSAARSRRIKRHRNDGTVTPCCGSGLRPWVKHRAARCCHPINSALIAAAARECGMGQKISTKSRISGASNLPNSRSTDQEGNGFFTARSTRRRR